MSHYTGCVISGQNWSTVFKKPEICFNTCSKASPLTADDDVRPLSQKSLQFCAIPRSRRSHSPRPRLRPESGPSQVSVEREGRSETVANLAAEETPRRPNDVHRSSKGERERRGRHTWRPSINDAHASRGCHKSEIDGTKN